MYKFQKVMISFEKEIDQLELVKMVGKRDDAHITKESALDYVLFVSEDDILSLFNDIKLTYGEFQQKYLQFA